MDLHAKSWRLQSHPVVVRPEPPGQFTAQPLGVPEIHVVAPTELEAVEKARQALAEWAGALYGVPVAGPQEAPLPAGAGHAKDDPDFDVYLDEIRRYRQEVEDRECPNSSSTPIT